GHIGAPASTGPVQVDGTSVSARLGTGVLKASRLKELQEASNRLALPSSTVSTGFLKDTRLFISRLLVSQSYHGIEAGCLARRGEAEHQSGCCRTAEGEDHGGRREVHGAAAESLHCPAGTHAQRQTDQA